MAKDRLSLTPTLSFSTLKLWDYSKGKVSFRHAAGLAISSACQPQVTGVGVGAADPGVEAGETKSHLLLISKFGITPFKDMFYEWLACRSKFESTDSLACM